MLDQLDVPILVLLFLWALYHVLKAPGYTGRASDQLPIKPILKVKRNLPHDVPLISFARDGILASLVVGEKTDSVTALRTQTCEHCLVAPTAARRCVRLPEIRQAIHVSSGECGTWAATQRKTAKYARRVGSIEAWWGQRWHSVFGYQ
ncbi:hypothetical protein BD626DRAFT_507544 [Schizophyllum amplum]|uniref:Uncharacterized protein n=1 Tax=Schizophyllum amplum TaxID=97359 RepID=A0A550C428_9AGAR|nr:hypothetical protein BD626DRAFT_507544 [Auriculariopsis ampla]